MFDLEKELYAVIFLDVFIKFKNILQKFRKCLAQPINLLNLKQEKIMHDYGGTHTYQTIHLPFKRNTKFWCYIEPLFQPEITRSLYPSPMFPITILLAKLNFIIASLLRDSRKKQILCLFLLPASAFSLHYSSKCCYFA